MKGPIIVMGMHRSGTRLLARILNDFGVFMGKKLGKNFEAVFFQEINQWMFNQLGGRWDYPPNMDDLYSNKEIYKLLIEYSDQCINGPKFLKYLGIKNYFFNRTTNEKNFLCGWKDPRNVYTLPVWLRLFPEAKVISIERHGIDVANSLMKRSLQHAEASQEKFNKNRWKYYFYSKKSGFTHSLRCCQLEGAFSLWEEYTREAQKHVKRLERPQVFKIGYEELVTNPEQVLNDVCTFLDLNIKPDRTRNSTVKIHPEMAYSYRNEPELKAFEEKVSGRLFDYEKR